MIYGVMEWSYGSAGRICWCDGYYIEECKSSEQEQFEQWNLVYRIIILPSYIVILWVSGVISLARGKNCIANCVISSILFICSGRNTYNSTIDIFI